MSIERTATGRRRVRWREAGKNRAHVCGTKADGRLFGAEITRRQRMGDLSTLDAGKMTLDAFARETWWKQHVEPNLERATRESYAGTWDRHIAPPLGGYPLREITAPIVRRWLDDMIAAGVGANRAAREGRAPVMSRPCRRAGPHSGQPGASGAPAQARAAGARPGDRPPWTSSA